MPVTANFEAVYGRTIATPRCPTIEDMLMMRPLRCSMSGGRKARVVRKTPRELIDSTWSYSSSVMSTVARGPMFMPALLTRTSTRPHPRRVVATRFWADPESRTSWRTAIEPSPNSTARFSASCRSMSASTSRAPAALSACAQARPIPRAPPVTTATLPSRSRMCRLLRSSLRQSQRWGRFNKGCGFAAIRAVQLVAAECNELRLRHPGRSTTGDGLGRQLAEAAPVRAREPAEVAEPPSERHVRDWGVRVEQIVAGALETPPPDVVHRRFAQVFLEREEQSAGLAAGGSRDVAGRHRLVQVRLDEVERPSQRPRARRCLARQQRLAVAVPVGQQQARGQVADLSELHRRMPQHLVVQLHVRQQSVERSPQARHGRGPEIQRQVEADSAVEGPVEQGGELLIDQRPAEGDAEDRRTSRVRHGEVRIEIGRAHV